MAKTKIGLNEQGCKRRDFLRKGAAFAALGLGAAAPALAAPITADDASADLWRTWNAARKESEVLVWRYQEIWSALPDDVKEPCIQIGYTLGYGGVTGEPINVPRWFDDEDQIKAFINSGPSVGDGVVPVMKDGKMTGRKVKGWEPLVRREQEQRDAAVAKHVAKLQKARADAEAHIEASGFHQVERDLDAAEERTDAAILAVTEGAGASVVSIAARLHILARAGIKTWTSYRHPHPDLVALLKSLAPHLPKDMADAVTADMADEYDGEEKARS